MLSAIRNQIAIALRFFQQTDDYSISCDDICLDQPNDPSRGDLYTNAAMMFSKRLRGSPIKIAEKIKEHLCSLEVIESVSIDGPGFVNFVLKNIFWNSVINKILIDGCDYSSCNCSNNERINVEFVSANPTGPLHTGHARNAVFGSVISNLLEKIGYDVTREFYINDQGNQIKALARSLFLRYKEALGGTITADQFTEDMYCGDYVKDTAKELIDIYGDRFLNISEDQWLPILCKFSIDAMLRNIKLDLASIGVVMDQYTSEAAICKKHMVEEALEKLKDNGDIYDGILPRPKGISEDDDWEERPQTLFKSTKYGDDVDRAIRKSDGTWTYFAGDLAYHLDKIKRGYCKMVGVLGADHNGYVKRLQAAVKALSDDKAEIKIRLYQLVNFLEDGKPIKMSKRSGTFITLKDVVNRVGKDVTRYMMISRHHDVMIDFDFVKAVECSMDNPLFYIQYAYARICSVFRNYTDGNTDIDSNLLINADKTSLKDESEVGLMKALLLWPEYVKGAAKALEPHRIPTYLQNIASLFHSLWNKGKTNTTLRFIDKTNEAETKARLSLLKATKTVIEDGLNIMGITPMVEMR